MYMYTLFLQPLCSIVRLFNVLKEQPCSVIITVSHLSMLSSGNAVSDGQNGCIEAGGVKATPQAPNA